MSKRASASSRNADSPAQRQTPQRDAILRVIQDSNGPLSVPEIHERARHALPQIGIATIYRTLKLLQESDQILVVILMPSVSHLPPARTRRCMSTHAPRNNQIGFVLQRHAKKEIKDVPQDVKPNAELLRFDDVDVGYERRCIVSDVPFTLSQGDYIAIVGSNGSGKTTLLRSLLGLIAPLSGRVSKAANLHFDMFHNCKPSMKRCYVLISISIRRFHVRFNRHFRADSSLPGARRRFIFGCGRRRQSRARAETDATKSGQGDAATGRQHGEKQNRVFIFIARFKTYLETRFEQNFLRTRRTRLPHRKRRLKQKPRKRRLNRRSLLRKSSRQNRTRHLRCLRAEHPKRAGIRFQRLARCALFQRLQVHRAT